MEEVGLIKTLDEFYRGKRIFLTGHTGFKGAWFLCWLNSLGSVVKGYSLPPESDLSLFDFIKPEIKFENVFADIRDKEQLKKEIEGFQPDIIFHLAAQALVRRSYQVPAETFEVNVVGTANLLEATNLLKKKCTVIIITTDKVYENKELEYAYTEDDVLGGYDPYSASKAATEIAVSSFRNSFFNRNLYNIHQKAILTARAGNVIGGGDWSKDRILPDIILALQSNQPIGIRNPNAVRPWQHVLEPLSGYLQLAMLAHKDYNNLSDAYNFGPLPDDHLPVQSLVETAISCWGKGEWKDISNPNELHEAGLLKLDVSRAAKELNWYPQLKSRQAVEWTVNWYKQKEESRFQFTLNQIKKYQAKWLDE